MTRRAIATPASRAQMDDGIAHILQHLHPKIEKRSQALASAREPERRVGDAPGDGRLRWFP